MLPAARAATRSSRSASAEPELARGRAVTEAAPAVDIADVEVIAPNFKRRLSGVTSTIVQLVPLQARTLGLRRSGQGFRPACRRSAGASSSACCGGRAGRPFRIWHARRNIEMIAGVLLRDVLRAPLKLVFTSAAQRNHQPLTKWLIRRMDAVIATNQRSAQLPRRSAHRDHARRRPRANSIRRKTPKTRFRRPACPGTHAIGCFGRVRHQKGTDLFVDAMIALLPEFPDWTAVVTGRVTVEHQAFARDLERRIAEAGLANRIVFLGEVPDIKLWYRRVSLYVAPSRNEGFGLTPLEAMASGSPVVASDAGAYADLIAEGETGYVVRPAMAPR